MTPFDPGLYPFIDSCLFFQGLFLNFLWVVLALGWINRARRFPDEAPARKVPGHFLMVSAAVVWVAVLGGSLVSFQPAHWFLGLALANGAFLSVLDPTLAICFTLSMLLMRPWEIMEANPMVLLVPKFSTLFSFAWAFYYTWRIDKFGIRVNKVVLLLIGWFTWLFLSTFVTPDPADSQAGLKATMIPFLILVYLIFHLARTRFSVWALKQSLMTVLSCVGVISLWFYINGYRVTGRIVAFGMFTNSNDVAAVMTILLPIALTTFLATRQVHERLFSMLSIGVGMFALLLAQSRGAVIAVGVGVATYFLRRVKNKLAAIGVIVLVAVSGMALTSLVFSRDKGDVEGSTENRSIFWVSGIRMALFNPMFGVGYNQFPANVEEYATRPPEEKGKRTAHSTWILALSESGFIGFALFLAFLYFGCLKPALAIYAQDPAWLYVGLMYATVITFLSHTYFMCTYLIVAIAMAAFLAEARRAKRLQLLKRRRQVLRR